MAYHGPIQGQLHGITYNATGGYVAVGYDYSIPRQNSIYLTSPDGVSWTGGTGPIQGGLSGITYDATGGYVAVGTILDTAEFSTIYLKSTDVISCDPISWTGSDKMQNIYPLFSSLTIDTIVDNTGSTGAPGQFLAAGPSGGSLVWSDTTVATSGITFTGPTGSILYSPDGVSVTGSGKLVYKQDVTTATQISIEGTLYGITNGPTGGYMAVGKNGNNTIYMSSSNGVSWTAGTGPIQGQRGIYRFLSILDKPRWSIMDRWDRVY